MGLNPTKSATLFVESCMFSTLCGPHAVRLLLRSRKPEGRREAALLQLPPALGHAAALFRAAFRPRSWTVQPTVNKLCLELNKSDLNSGTVYCTWVVREIALV